MKRRTGIISKVYTPRKFNSTCPWSLFPRLKRELDHLPTIHVQGVCSNLGVYYWYKLYPDLLVTYKIALTQHIRINKSNLNTAGFMIFFLEFQEGTIRFPRICTEVPAQSSLPDFHASFQQQNHHCVSPRCQACSMPFFCLEISRWKKLNRSLGKWSSGRKTTSFLWVSMWNVASASASADFLLKK